MTDERAVIGVDVGGTGIKGGLFSTVGTVLASIRTHSPAAGGEQLVTAIQAQIAQLRATADRSGYELCAVGVITPGIVDHIRGRILYAANLNWTDIALADRLREAAGSPVLVGHDVRGASLAERYVGGARGVDDFILVSLGTGISCSIVLGGVPLRGVTGSAGELGHVPIVPGGELCSCGQRGCLEIYAGASGIVRRYRQAGGAPDLGAEQIARRVADDPLARRIWNEGTEALGRALTGLVLLVDTELILLSGGLSGAGEQLLDPVRATVAEHLQWRSAPRIELSPLGADGGMLGAAMLAMRSLGLDDEIEHWRHELLLPLSRTA